MNRDILIGAALLVGGAIGGYMVGSVVTDNRLRSEYEESARAYRRATNLAKDVDGEIPEETEEGLFEINDLRQLHEETMVLYHPEVNAYSPVEVNPYHVAITAIETPIGTFVSGEPNAYGISYIEDEDFTDVDGRDKHTITMVMDAHNPTFFMEGMQIDDWADRLGASIVKDFFDLTPPGLNPILYVRNHRTDTDYEVTPERP